VTDIEIALDSTRAALHLAETGRIAGDISALRTQEAELVAEMREASLIDPDLPLEF
jgi:hypothetical protein